MIDRYEFTEWSIDPPQPSMLVDRVRRSPWQSWLTVMTLAVAMIGLFVAPIFRDGSTAFGLLGGLGLALYYAVFALFHRARFGQAGLDVRDLMDLPPVVVQYPVEVVYHACGIAYGQDVGIVAINDGVLNFQGRKSRFSLALDHFASIVPMPGKSVGALNRYDFGFDQGNIPFQVAIYCYDSVPGVESHFQRRFRVAVNDFIKLPAERGQVAVLPPPLYPEERFMARYRRLVAVARSAAVASLGLIICVALWYHEYGSVNWIAGGIGGLLLANFAIRRSRSNTRILNSLAPPPAKSEMPLAEQIVIIDRVHA